MSVATEVDVEVDVDALLIRSFENRGRVDGFGSSEGVGVFIEGLNEGLSAQDRATIEASDELDYRRWIARGVGCGVVTPDYAVKLSEMSTGRRDQLVSEMMPKILFEEKNMAIAVKALKLGLISVNDFRLIMGTHETAHRTRVCNRLDTRIRKKEGDDLVVAKTTVAVVGTEVRRGMYSSGVGFGF